MLGSACRRGMVLLVFCWALGAAYGAHITVSVGLDGPTSCWVGDELDYTATASYTLDAATQEEVANGATVTTEYTWTYSPATWVSGGSAQDSELEIVYPATTPGGYHTVSVSYRVVVHLVGGGTISGVGSDDIAVAVRRFTVSLSTDKESICAGAGDSDVHKAHLTATVSDGVGGPYANRTVTFSTQCDFYQTGPALSVTEGVTDANGVVQTTLTSGDGVANCVVSAACEGTTAQGQIAFEEPTKELHTLDLETGYDILHLTPDGEAQCRVALTVTYRGSPVPGHPLEWSFSFWAAGAGETPTYTGQGPVQYGALSSMAGQTDANGQATALYTSGTTTGSVKFQTLDGAVYTKDATSGTWSKMKYVSLPLDAFLDGPLWTGQLFARSACIPEGYPALPMTDRVWHDCFICIRLRDYLRLEDFYIRGQGQTQWAPLYNDRTAYESGLGWSEYRERWLIEQQGNNAECEWMAMASLGAPVPENAAPPLYTLYGTFTPYNIVAGNRQDTLLVFNPGDEVEIPWGIEHGYPPSCACPGGDEFSACAKVYDLAGNLIWHKHQNGITLEAGGSQQGHKEGNIVWEGQRLDNETPTAGVYAYRILVDHVSTLGLESEGMCGQEETVDTPTLDREKNVGLIDSVTEFAYWNFDPQAGTMSVATKYKRNGPASACSIRYFGPNATGEIVQLGEVALTGDLGSGEYWSPSTTLNVQVDENGNLEGTYYTAVSALETATGGLVNRDLQPRYGLQKGLHTLTPVPWGAQLKSVGFDGTGNTKVCKDSDSADYETPEWEDNSSPLDGDADDADDPNSNNWDHKSPICYQKASIPEATVRLHVFPAGTLTGGEPWLQDHPIVRIRGVGPDSLDFPETAATYDNTDGTEKATLTSDDPLADVCQRYNPLSITWYARIDGGAWQQVGTSQNECFVTLADPTGGSRYRTVLYLATKEGGATESACLNGTWQAFACHSVCRWNGATREYDKPLYYYYTWIGHDIRSAPALLASSEGDGQCGAWAELLDLALKANGVSSQVMEVRAPSPFDGFGVKNIAFDAEDPTWPVDQWDNLISPSTRPSDWQAWIYESHWDGTQLTTVDDLDITLAGVPGEHMQTPKQKLFGIHYIVEVPSASPPYYDPSYGISAADAASYTDMAVAAWARPLVHDVEGGRVCHHWRERAGSGPDNLVIALPTP